MKIKIFIFAIILLLVPTIASTVMIVQKFTTITTGNYLTDTTGANITDTTGNPISTL